jgi:hypothetical protein
VAGFAMLIVLRAERTDPAAAAAPSSTRPTRVIDVRMGLFLAAKPIGTSIGARRRPQGAAMESGAVAATLASRPASHAIRSLARL